MKISKKVFDKNIIITVNEINKIFQNSFEFL